MYINGATCEVAKQSHTHRGWPVVRTARCSEIPVTTQVTINGHSIFEVAQKVTAGDGFC